MTSGSSTYRDRSGASEWFPRQRVGDLPALAAHRFGDREAMVAGNRRWSFEEFEAEVDRLARALIASGVAHGDRVALWMANRVEWIFLLFALARIGAVLVPLNTRYRTVDMAHSVRQSGCSTFILCDKSGPVDFMSMVRDAYPSLGRQAPESLQLPEAPDLRRIVTVGPERHPATIPFDAVVKRADECSDEQLARRIENVDPDDVLLIAYTSGTTGLPKGVMHGHCCIRNVSDGASRLGITEADTLLNYLPMFHLYAYSACALTSVVTGARQVLQEMFEAEEALDLIERERVTLIHGFDAHYRDLMAAQARKPRDIASLRLGTFPAGMANSAPTAAQAQQEICPTVSVYGMTELWTFPTLTFLDSSPEQRSAASGYPMPGYDIRVVDSETGVPLERGAVGEIRVRGYMVTRGYFDDPDATRSSFDEEGYFRTGDTGLIRPDGHLVFLGRSKDILKVGGENVSPAEVEAFLMQMDGVIEAAVVGTPDERLAEVPVAFLRCAAGVHVGLEQVDAHCRNRIASFKVPRQVFVVDELPMTTTGKVQKHLLRARAAELLGSDGGPSPVDPRYTSFSR